MLWIEKAYFLISVLYNKTMGSEIGRFAGFAKTFLTKDSPRHSTLEFNRECNRRCHYCAVPEQYNRDRELTVEETFNRVDWLYDQGFRLLSLLGGEPLGPFITKEEITFAEHTLRVVAHAVQKGMAVNVTTNGDYVIRDTVKKLKHAGLDSLSLSLHTYSQSGLQHLLKAARMAAEEGIIPTVSAVFTSARADQFPGIAAEVASTGTLFGFGIVQEKAGGFSAMPKEGSQIPTPDEQKEVFRALLRLKTFGMIRNNRRYMREIPNYPNNSWTCNPETDAFINLGADDTVNVCTDVRTNFTTADIPILDSSQNWREAKRVKVKNCGNCAYSCYFESQHPDVIGDIPMFGVMALIRTGNVYLAEKWGEFAVEQSKRMEKDIDWNLKI